MNPLRNPIVVGVLVVVAVGFAAYQVFQPHWRPTGAPGAVTEETSRDGARSTLRSTATEDGRSALPAALPGAVLNETNRDGVRRSAPPAPAPGPVMDTNYAAARMSDWINAPARDPFLLAHKSAASSSPPPQWILKAIWRQDGVTMAAINQGIYRLGDVLDGYIIININDNEVWFEKDARKMFLGFGRPEPAKPAAPK